MAQHTVSWPYACFGRVCCQTRTCEPHAGDCPSVARPVRLTHEIPRGTTPRRRARARRRT